MNFGPSRSRLLLTELIFSVALFIICAVVCACLLLQSWFISRDSTRLTAAVTAAQSIAEQWRATGTPPPQEQSLEQGLTALCTLENGALTISIQSREGASVYILKEVAPGAPF